MTNTPEDIVDDAITRPKKRAAQPRYSTEELKTLSAAAFSRKMEAIDTELQIRPDGQWKSLTDDWASWSESQRRDVVFGLAYYSGFKAKDVARLFRMKIHELQPYAEVIEQGLVALKYKITTNQIAFGLLSDQPVLKFHLGKQFAEQVDNPAHEGVDSLSAVPTIVINEVKADNSAMRAELEDAVHAAQAVGKPVLRSV